jgi:hypothetical protein
MIFVTTDDRHHPALPFVFLAAAFQRVGLRPGTLSRVRLPRHDRAHPKLWGIMERKVIMVCKSYGISIQSVHRVERAKKQSAPLG